MKCDNSTFVNIFRQNYMHQNILVFSITAGASWKQGQWTKDEIEILMTNINNYCKVTINNS